jgi:hypothetical protein
MSEQFSVGDFWRERRGRDGHGGGVENSHSLPFSAWILVHLILIRLIRLAVVFVLLE